jgi:dynein heavy chain 1
LYVYRLDAKLLASPETVSTLAIIKKAGVLDRRSSLDNQLQSVVLPILSSTTGGSPYEVLHSVLHFAVAPYFDAFCTATGKVDSVSADDDKAVIPTARRKITELELSFLHLQQNMEIPSLTLSLHPVVEHALTGLKDGSQVNIDLIAKNYLEDINFLNSLQANVNGWIKSIQGITRISRDTKSGTASQEINFWLSMEVVLRNIEAQLQSPGVTLTLEILRFAKRFHATVSFISDTGIKEATEKVQRYNQLMRDFPLDDLISATTLSDIREAVDVIFGHINKKLRISPYPVWRALALVESISADLDSTLRSLLRAKRLMYLDFGSFNAQLMQAKDIFNAWDANVKDFFNVAREVTRKRSEKFIPIRIASRHSNTEERLNYVTQFRVKHDQLKQTLIKVLDNKKSRVVGDDEAVVAVVPLEFAGINPVEEISSAYDFLKDVDVLDTSDGTYLLFYHQQRGITPNLDGMNQWNNAEKLYNEQTTRVEQAIIAMLRDRLAVAKNSNEMFRVFSKFNALFERQAIRGAIQEYQNRLIENVKRDVAALQDRFKQQQYPFSEAHEMSKLRDIPVVSATIIWMKQIEHQLNTYMQRVQDILGTDWQSYAEGEKLSSERDTFRKKLDTAIVYRKWVDTVSNRNLSISGYIFRIIKLRSTYELQVNFDPQVITLFKEVRDLCWLDYQVPHPIANVAKDAKRVYPFAVSLIDSLQTFWQTLSGIDQFPELEPLLYGSENAVGKVISEGILLKWQTFAAHNYDFESVAFDRSEIRYASDLEGAVGLLQQRTNHLFALYAVITKAMEQLTSCPYQFAEFDAILDVIQDSVDKLNLELYTNVSEFVDLMNERVRNILISRTRQVVEVWMSSFQDPSLVTSLPFKLHQSTHELTLKNQVISLSPPIEATRVSWLKNLQDNIGAACRLRKMESDRFDVKLGQDARSSKQRSSFSDIPRAMSNILLRAYQMVDEYLSDAADYLDKWYQFQALWDLEASQVFDMLGTDMEKWLQVLLEIRKARSTFDTNEVSKMFGMLKIDFKPVQARINSKYDSWQSDIIHKFAQRLNTKMKETCSEMETARRELETRNVDTSSTELVLLCITSIQHCHRNLDRWESEVALFRQGQTTLARYRFQFPSNWLFIDQIDNEWSALNEILVRRTKVIDAQNDAIKAKVSSELMRLGERLNTLEEQWQTDKPVSGSLGSKVALGILSKYEAEASSISASADLLVKAATALDIEFQIPSGLQVISEEINDFNSVWGALDTVWNALHDLRETPWASVVPRKIRQQLDEFVQLTKNMPTRIRQYSAFQHIQNVLKNLVKANPLLSELRSEAIHERHWETLYKILVPSNRVYFTSMTLGQVWDMNLSVNASKVRDVIAVAQGELALENYLRLVRETWTIYSLELVNYQNICRLIKNWDDIFQKCGDHLNSLSAMHHSPYFKVFEDEARAWEDKLTRLHVLFDIWIDVQRQWVYLEGVFSNNAEIKHILPVESSRFQNINSELFVILRKVSKSPLVLDVLNIPGIQVSIERLADMLGKVQKALGEYFEKERQRFGRFYFVGDEDLLEIIGNSNDIHRTEKHLRKMFSGISGLILDRETSAIDGILSREGERLLFSSNISLVKLPKVVDWLIELEAQTKVSLSDQLTKAVPAFHALMGTQEFDGQMLLQWMRQFVTQVNILATQVYWTSSIDQALRDSATGLDHLKDRHQRLLRCLAGFVIDDLSLLDRKCCESLITELVHQTDILSKFIDENVRNPNDFAWQSQMTYYFDPSVDPTDRLIVKQANAQFVYGFEYLGLPDKLVSTPLVDKCFLSMTQALDQRLGGSPFGPAGTGKCLTNI